MNPVVPTLPLDPTLPLEDGLAVRLPRISRPNRQPQDTEAGCRARAAANLEQAATMDTAHGRDRLEHSAASWTTRADLLHRLDASSDARRAATAAD